MGLPKIKIGENEITWFNTVDSGFASMLEAIDSACRTIDLEMYIFRNDAVGHDFRTALLDAQARGVKIRVMLDGLGSVTLASDYWNELVKGGGEFRLFNPVRITGPIFRDHRKLLAVDGKIAFIGGFNIGEEYRGDGIEHGWHDCGCRLDGPGVGVLVGAFEQMWQRSEHKRQFLPRLRKGSADHRAMGERLSLLLTGPGRAPFVMQETLLADIRKAKTINIISAYFLPPRKLLRGLMRAARAGVKVRLLLAGKTDVQVAMLAAHRLYHPLLKAGVEIYEYEPQILHTKCYLIDQTAYIGSANMDIRSLRINYELLVRCEDQSLAGTMLQFFEQALNHSKLISLADWKSHRNFWTKMKEEWAWLILARLDPWLSQAQVSASRPPRNQNRRTTVR